VPDGDAIEWDDATFDAVLACGFYFSRARLMAFAIASQPASLGCRSSPLL
jgi:hypothetical protein